jgi:radial spoke head protein 9
MPTLNDQHKDVINSETSLFNGEPMRKVGVVGDGDDGDQQDDKQDDNDEDDDGGDGEKKKLDSDASEEEEIKIPKRALTELDRLTYTVYAIENDCQLVPVGAFKMTPQHQVRRNEAFSGLSERDSVKVENYLHFRNV